MEAILANCKGDTECMRAEWEKTSKKKFDDLTLEFNCAKRKEELEELLQKLLAVMAAESGRGLGGVRSTPSWSTRLSTQINAQVGAQRKNDNRLPNSDAYDAGTCGAQRLGYADRAQKLARLEAGFTHISCRDFGCFVRSSIRLVLRRRGGAAGAGESRRR